MIHDSITILFSFQQVHVNTVSWQPPSMLVFTKLSYARFVVLPEYFRKWWQSLHLKLFRLRLSGSANCPLRARNPKYCQTPVFFAPSRGSSSSSVLAEPSAILPCDDLLCACTVSQLGISARYDSNTRRNIAIIALLLLSLRPTVYTQVSWILCEQSQQSLKYGARYSACCKLSAWSVQSFSAAAPHFITSQENGQYLCDA